MNLNVRDSGTLRIPESSARPSWFKRHFSGLLIGSLLLSLLFHFIALPLFSMLFFGRRTPVTPQEIVYVARSSALRITHRSRPLPPRRAHRAVTPQRQPVRTQRAQRAQRQPHSRAVRREIARIDPRALRPVPPKLQYNRQSLTSPQTEQEQFEQTIARLRASNNPVISAERPVRQAQTEKHYSYNFSSSIGTVGSGQGILDVVRSWQDDGYDYYYVRYWVEYPDGTTETGVVPWPIRYLPAQDPFRLGIHHMPLPVPLTGYTLPPGTVLHPLVAYCFKHRDELSDCPIQHD